MKENLPMLIVPRQGHQAQLLGENATMLAVTPLATSSTEVRQRIANGENYDELVTEKVAQVLASEYS